MDEAFGFTVESFNVTAHERTHIEKYRTLDSYGKGAVDTLLDSEYNRCLDQNLTDYRSRLRQLDEELKHIQEKVQESGGRTLDDITEEIRRIRNMADEVSWIDRNLDIAVAIAAQESPQASSAPQEGKDTPATDGPKTLPEGGETG